MWTMKKINVLLGIVLSVSLTSCKTEKEMTLMNNTNLNCGFDTFCRLDAYVESEDEFNTYYRTMVDDFAYYHKLFDIYHNYDGINNIKTINDNAGINPVKVDQNIIDLIKLAKEVSELSDGAFDITSGALLKIWHNYRDEGKDLNSNGYFGNTPSMNELEEAAEYKGYEHIIVDDENNTVFIDNASISLDVGGIGKGFAVEKVARHLEDMGLKYGSVNGGGNQRIVNTKPDGSGFNVGIQNPRGENSSIIAVLKNQSAKAVVTSGDYQNYYIAEDNVIYSHIIDPATLFPANHYSSVTIAIDDSGLADCLSTALFVLDYDDGLSLIDKIESKYDKDIIAVWITDKPLSDASIQSSIDNTQFITVTDNFADEIVTE